MNLSQQLLRYATESGRQVLDEWQQAQPHLRIEQLPLALARLLPAVHANLASQLADYPGRSRLEPLYQAALQRNLKLQAGLRDIARELAAIGVPVMALKAMALNLGVYRDLGTRVAGDIDILVPPERAREAIEHLRARGWSPRQEPPRCLCAWHATPLVREGAHLDLHWFALFECRGPGADDSLWKQATRREVDGATVYLPDLRWQVVHTLVHAGRQPGSNARYLLDLHHLGKLLPQLASDSWVASRLRSRRLASRAGLGRPGWCDRGHSLLTQQRQGLSREALVLLAPLWDYLAYWREYRRRGWSFLEEIAYWWQVESFQDAANKLRRKGRRLSKG